MIDKKNIDALIDSFIREEQNTSSNPFLATRVMVLVNVNNKEQGRFFPAWQGVVMALSFLAAIAIGIKAGSLYGKPDLRQDQTSVMYMSDEKMEHFEFYRQAANE
jgi:hypothetical protein